MYTNPTAINPRKGRKFAFTAMAIAAFGLTFVPMALAQDFGDEIGQDVEQMELQGERSFNAGFNFNKNRPRLVVLVHGITSEKLQAPEEKIGTSAHARWYWGFDQIKGFSGFPNEASARVITPWKDGTLRFRTTLRGNWSHKTHVPESSNELAPIVYPMSWMSGNLPIDTNQAEIKTYLRLMTKPGTNPVTGVMVPYRIGSKHLMPQTADTINQVYETYMKAFGHLAEDAQPQLYFVGHSFGGIISRTIMSNPTGADLYGNKLTATERARANFLRDRTVHVTTVSTPHFGTPLIDQSQDAAAFVRLRGGNIQTAAAGIDAIMKIPPFSWLGVELNLAKTVRTAVLGALDAVAGERDCLNDIKRMPEYNAGILQPTLARRSTGIPVPIYTITGRDPGATYYDRSRAPFIIGGEWLPYSILDLFPGERMASNAAKMYAVQSLLHEAGYGKKGKMPWGPAAIPEADQMISGLKGVGPTNARPVSAGIELTASLVGNTLWDVLKAKPYLVGKDGENDSDGFVGFDSGHGLGLTGGAWYRIYNRTEYGTHLPWDNDNHATITFNPGVGQWIHNELLREAGPYYSSTQRISRFLGQGAAIRPSHSVKVEVLEVHDSLNNLDTVTQADFTMQVRIGDAITTQNGKDNTRTATGFKPVYRTSMPNSIIPIRIAVSERDPVGDPNDHCTITRVRGRDTLYLYFDTRTQTITGDVNALAGDIITSDGPYGATNRARVKVRITGS